MTVLSTSLLLLLVFIYCLIQGNTVTANERECSSRNQTEAGGYFKLDERFVCQKRIKVNIGFYIKMSFPASNTTVVEVEEFRDGKKASVHSFSPNDVTYESQENEIDVRIQDSSSFLEVRWWRECGKVHRQTEQYFNVKGPSIISGYPNHTRCTWEISSSDDFQIMLQVQEIRAQNQTLGDCSYDYVQVTGILTGEIRSTTTCLSSRTSTYYYYSPLSILFFSDSNSDAGIIFIFRTSLVKIIRGYQGQIESPGYPSSYHNNTQLTWILEVPMGFQLCLTFDDFRLEKEHDGKCYDYVKIIDPGHSEVNKTETSYCGTSIFNSSRTSGKQRMELHFFSDQGVADKGFTAYWVTVCGGTFDGNNGELIGPNIAFGYPDNQTCTWEIILKNGYKLSVRLNVTGYKDRTNCSLDYIQVLEKRADRETNGTRICSGEITLDTTKSVNIIFHSDNDGTSGISFNVTWQSTESSNGSNHALMVTLPQENRKVSSPPLLVSDFIVAIASPSVAFVIILLIFLLVLQRRKLMFCLSKEVEEAAIDTEDILYDSINDKAINLESTKVQNRTNTHHYRTNPSKSQISSRKLPSPPMGRLSSLVTRVRKSMHLRHVDEFAHGESMERRHLPLIGDHTVCHENQQRINHMKKAEFSQEIHSVKERLPNQGYIYVVDVDQGNEESICCKNLFEIDRALIDTSNNDGYITAVHSCAIQRNILSIDSLIGDDKECHENRHKAIRPKQEPFSQGSKSVDESQGYIIAAEVDKKEKEYVCCKHITETNSTVIDTSDNDGYITPVNSSV